MTEKVLKQAQNVSPKLLATSNMGTRLDGSTTETSSHIEPHFINYTNTVLLNDISRTEVRVQVMKEYHRRRKLGKTSTSEDFIRNKPPSAKAQTQKFRLDQEKILRPWVRMKSYVGKKRETTSPKLDGIKKSPSKHAVPNPNSHQETEEEATTFGNREDETEAPENLEHAGNFDSALPLVQQWRLTLESSLETTSLFAIPSTGALDPFSAMSLLITPRIQLLLHHYFNVRLASSWLMMPMRKGLFSLAVHDAALFHTFMSHYVAAYNLRFSTGDPAESMQHRTEAIRIVNERLKDPGQALSDGNIAAVANMAVYESSNGSTKSMVVHLNGLVDMVNMRGGIENGGFAPHVRRLIGWTDLHCASALSSKPRFPPLGIPIMGLPGNASLRFLTDSEYSSAINTPGLDDTFAQLQALSSTMSMLRKQSVLPEENIWYSDKIYSLQHRLFDEIQTSYSQRGSLDAACSIAALIFCSTCLRDIGFNFRIIATAVTRLKAAILEFLEKHLIPKIDFPLGLKLFWVLGLGGIASDGKDERRWFVEKFRKMAGVLGLKDWEAAEGVLGSVLWQEDLSGFGRKMWVEAHSDVW